MPVKYEEEERKKGKGRCYDDTIKLK